MLENKFLALQKQFKLLARNLESKITIGQKDAISSLTKESTAAETKTNHLLPPNNKDENETKSEIKHVKKY
jgi:hypothetical protein